MTIAAARSVFRSSAARSAAARLASQPKSAPSAFRLPSRSPLAQRLLRSPVELSVCVDSLQPYHTATASALMMSMLTVSRCGFAWLSEETLLVYYIVVSRDPVKLSFAVLQSFMSLVKIISDAYGSFLRDLHTINEA